MSQSEFQWFVHKNFEPKARRSGVRLPVRNYASMWARELLYGGPKSDTERQSRVATTRLALDHCSTSALSRRDRCRLIQKNALL